MIPPPRAAVGLEPVLTRLGVSGVWSQRRTERLPGQPLVCGAAWQPEMPWPPWAQEAWGLPGVRGQEIRGDVDVAPACWYLSHRKTRPPWLKPVFAGSGDLWPNVSSWNYSSPGTIGGSKGVTLRRERNGLNETACASDATCRDIPWYPWPHPESWAWAHGRQKGEEGLRSVFSRRQCRGPALSSACRRPCNSQKGPGRLRVCRPRPQRRFSDLVACRPPTPGHVPPTRGSPHAGCRKACLLKKQRSNEATLHVELNTRCKSSLAVANVPARSELRGCSVRAPL